MIDAGSARLAVSSAAAGPHWPDMLRTERSFLATASAFL